MNATQKTFMKLNWLSSQRRSLAEVAASHLTPDELDVFILDCEEVHARHVAGDHARREPGAYPFSKMRETMEADTAAMAASIATMRTFTGPIGPMPEEPVFGERWAAA